jgi:hypothetical protein
LREPAFEISLIRSGVAYETAVVVVTKSNSGNVATFNHKITLTGPTDVSIRPVLFDSEKTLVLAVGRTYGIKIGARVFPLDRVTDAATGKGLFRVATTPPPGLRRLKNNLEKAWGLLF